MRPDELYNLIWDIDYRKSGFDLDWQTKVFHDEKVIRLFFQPSASKKDWFVNIAGFLPTLRVVKGFPMFFTIGWLKVFEACEDLILDDLIWLINNYPEYKVEVCGHSYGGAMSVIAAIKLYQRTAIKADVTTFGAPQPLFLLITKIFSKLFTGTVKQYRHKSDIVPYMPPFVGYHNINNKWLGKFSIKGLFQPYTYHLSYKNPDLYKN